MKKFTVNEMLVVAFAVVGLIGFVVLYSRRTSSDSSNVTVSLSTSTSTSTSTSSSSSSSSNVPTFKHQGDTFFVIGDWGKPGKRGQRRVAEAMVNHAAKCQLSFVVSTGDNLYTPEIKTKTDIAFKKHFEEMYSGLGKQIKWYMSLGNHDHEGDVTKAELEYAGHVPHSWYQPTPYYSVITIVNNVAIQFFVLDSYEGENMEFDHMKPLQLKWLDECLSKSTARWKIVVGHRPVYSGGHGHGNSPWLLENLVPIMEKYNVHAHFSGDDHTLQVLRQKKGGIYYIVSGAGSMIHTASVLPETLFAEQRKANGFVSVQVTNETLKMDVVVISKKRHNDEEQEKIEHTFIVT